jgi:hypothetical protein
LELVAAKKGPPPKSRPVEAGEFDPVQSPFKSAPNRRRLGN